MLDLKAVVDDLEGVRAAVARRGPEHARSLDAIAELAKRRSETIQRLEALRAQKNEANQAMAKLDKKGEAFQQRRAAMKEIAQETKRLEAVSREVEAELGEALMGVPNPPADNAPDGHSEADNRYVREHGEKPVQDFEVKDHVDLGTGLGILDFERAAKISGARFNVLKGAGARMERALMSFMLDLHADTHGYTEVWPPALVLDKALRGTSQLPKFGADLFRLAGDWDDGSAKEGAPRRDLYLAPTAEVPVTNLHQNEILEAEQLPVRYCAYTACFRSEAGSYGKDTRGMIRQHQFDKVELVHFERPEQGEAALEKLTAAAEAVLQKLGLHYRVMELCAGDMGFAARRCYDIEVWLPGQQAYREISSCSWFGDFQARRAKIRYRPAKGDKPKLLHTLNGSGLAIGRTLVAILEQNQQADGSVKVPEALVPYMGGLEVIS
ncbi:MAG: serine--tRNA ligase [Myxococcales bacterium]|nr:serine--tRNA ligase [Myxococcales bacterium]